MRPIFLFALVSFLGLAANAHALTVDERTNRLPDGSAKFSDPDEAVTFLHSGDNAEPRSGFHLQGGIDRNAPETDYSIAPGPSGNFNRAVENQQR